MRAKERESVYEAGIYLPVTGAGSTTEVHRSITGRNATFSPHDIPIPDA